MTIQFPSSYTKFAFIATCLVILEQQQQQQRYNNNNNNKQQTANSFANSYQDAVGSQRGGRGRGGRALASLASL